MKNIFSIFKIENIKKHLKEVVSRFPISVGIIAIVALCFLTMNHGSFSSAIEDNIVRAIFSLIITFFLSLGVYISSESLEYDFSKKTLIQ